MALTRRVLTPDEWHRLEGTEAAPFAAAPTGLDVQPFVVEDAGIVVGTWALQRCDVAEGCWIHPAHRNRAAVARALLSGLRECGEERGVRAVLTRAPNDEVATMLLRLGAVEVPFRHFVLPIGGPRCQPSR